MSARTTDSPFKAFNSNSRLSQGGRWTEEIVQVENMVRLLSTLALRGAVRDVAVPYEAAGGARIEAEFAPTLGILDRLRHGEAADVVILTREGLDELVRSGAWSRKPASIWRAPLSASR